MDIEMAGNGRVMTYDNLTDVPATSSLVRLFFLFSAPVDISGARKMVVVQPSIGAEGQGPPRGNITDLRRPVIVLHHDGAWTKGEVHYRRCELSST